MVQVRTATLCAQEAGHIELLAWAMATEALLVESGGRPRHALDLLAAATGYRDRVRSGDRSGRVIFLNGTSSAGKTTLARAIQDESDTPFVYWGVDTLFSLVPPNWGGGRDGPLSRDGFWYDRTGGDADGHPTVVIRYGEVGRRMLRSARIAAAAFAHGGDDLVIDELLLTPDLLPQWMDALSGLEVLLVCVTCPLAVAEQRERDRRNPNGLARGHYRMVHDHGTIYDMTVDSTTGTPAELARAVLHRQLAR